MFHVSSAFRTRRVRAFSGLCVAGLFVGLSACSQAPSTTDSTTLDSSTAASSPQAGLLPLGEANEAKKTQSAGAPAQLVVTTMRTGTHEGFDRVVFELQGQGTPGWFADYVDAPTQQASGHPIEVEGDTFLNINIDGTTYPFELGIEDPVLAPVPGHGPVVQQVVNGGTFEGHSQFIIGMKGKHPHSIELLDNPTRVVVDIRG